MRTLGIAASAAGEPARMMDDWTESAGTERVSDDNRGVRFGMFAAEDEDSRYVYGMLRSFNCVSTLVYATRALFKSMSHNTISIRDDPHQQYE